MIRADGAISRLASALFGTAASPPPSCPVHARSPHPDDLAEHQRTERDGREPRRGLRDDRQDDGLRGARLAQFSLQQFQQQMPVGQRGERIVLGKMAGALLHPFALGNVSNEADEPTMPFSLHFAERHFYWDAEHPTTTVHRLPGLPTKGLPGRRSRQRREEREGERSGACTRTSKSRARVGRTSKKPATHVSCGLYW